MSVRNGLLALLEPGPKYGFQLKKEFEELTAGVWPLNVGQVYTTLARLARDGLVSADGGPDESADEGQRRYQLTDAGRVELATWWRTPRSVEHPERDELVIKFALAAASHPHELTDLIDLQRAEALGALQRLVQRKARLDPADLAQAVVLDALGERIESELRWLDRTEQRLAGLHGTDSSPNDEQKGNRR
jgi:DNA-binding PadR family transcriptional regulator